MQFFIKYQKLLAPVLVIASIVIYFAWSYIDRKGDIGMKADIPLIEGVVESTSSETASISTAIKYIFVDISGAVESPGIYKVADTSRLIDVLSSAGGISKYADALWVAQNLNLAQKLKDAEKLYIPFVSDRDTDYVSAGLNLICPSTTNHVTSNSGSTSTSSDKVDVNTATKNELIDLPSIGEVTAEKIIAGRPYQDIDAFYDYMSFGAATKEKLVSILVVN